jgi:nitrite transporter NirC
MYNEAIGQLLNNAQKQARFLKGNPFGYLLSAMLSGVFISLSVILYSSVWTQNSTSPAVELLSGAMVPLGLILVVFAGTMLFTANPFIITLGAIKKKISWLDLAKIIPMVYVGNWIGTLLISLVFKATGHLQGALAANLVEIFAAKLDLSFWQIIARGFLCNILVCAAIWSTHRFESFTAKFLIIFFSLLAFMATGFENCIANMSQGSLALLSPGGMQAIGIGNYLWVILGSTLGNISAGVFVFALPFWLFSKSTKTEMTETS